MRDVLLHIGMHKTGTSSLQESLYGYDDGITSYAKFDVANHSIPITTIFAENPYDYHIWKNQGFSKLTVDAMRSKYASILENSISDLSRQRLIISGEDIGILKNDEKIRLIEYFKSKSVCLYISCFTRDPLSLSSSSIQQHIRGGMANLVKISPSYRFRIEQFQKNTPPCRLEVRDYKNEVLRHGDIVKAFSVMYNLDISSYTSSYHNSSLSLTASRLVLLFNRLPLNSFGSESLMSARHKLIGFLSDVFPQDNHGTRIDSRIASSLIQVEEDDLHFLRDKFDIDYSNNYARHDIEQCNLYFSDISDVKLSALREGMAKIGLDSRSNQSISDMLISIYHHFLPENRLYDADANYLRDIAIKIAEKKDLVIEDAVMLMELAHRARPTGPFIRNKLEQYVAQLQFD